ncbi:hypothetical protein Tco_0908141 [Tanacetum coccineum]|uniref:Reverse transcriptase domain-containing protein n=1 Tax=Tanacetum coccineum TaxID=301880 RepID=A0ABQ5CLA5_9ASTR
MILLLAEKRFLKINQAVEEEQNQPEKIQELLLKLINDLEILNDGVEWKDSVVCCGVKDGMGTTIHYTEEDVPKENFKIYSNPLFEFDEEILSSKIDPLYNEIDSIPQGNDNDHFNAESDLIESLLNRDTSMVSSPKIDSLLEEFSSELAHIDLIPPGIDEADFDPEEDIRLIDKLLYDNSSPRPPKELNYEIPDAIIESFSPSPIPVEDSDSLIEEIDIFLAPDDSIPPGRHSRKPSDDDIYFDIESNTGVLTTKLVDDISDNSTRELYVHKEKYPHLLSHRGFKVFQLINDSESPMMIYRGDIPILDVPYLHFYPP